MSEQLFDKNEAVEAESIPHAAEKPQAEKPQTAEDQGQPTAVYRVLHSADWHLGKMLGDASREEEHRRFLAWLLATIRQQKIDALIVAGDVFDSARPPQSAVKQYYEFLADLYRETCGSCRVILTAGNHDSPAHLDAPREILKALNAIVVGDLPEDISEAVFPLPDDDHPALLVAAIPFLRDRDLRSGRLGQSADEIQEDLRSGIAARYEQAAAACEHEKWNGAAKLAVGHLTVQGAKDSDSEREIHIGGLGAVGCDAFPDAFAYVALGHLHRPQKIEPSARLCYSGSPIPLSFSEATDKKTVRVLEFADGKLVGNETLAIPVSRYLVQLRTKRAELEQAIREAELPQSDLPTWVELIVETTDPGEDVTTLAREYAAGKPFVINRLLREMSGEAARLTEAGLPEESIEELLDNPTDVFDRRLEQETDLTDEERVALRTAFAELCEAEERSHEESATVSSVNETGNAQQMQTK